MNIVTGIVFVHAVLSGTVYSNTCNTFQISQENNKVLVGHSIMEINNTASNRECAQTCMSFSICKSIDYDRKGKTCTLNDVDKSSADPSEFAVKDGSVFSNINEWPSALAKGCGTRPCQNNQRCIVNGSSYVCQDITCRFDQQIDNGAIQSNAPGENRFLDIASVNCDVGYAADPQEVQCQASGEWQHATCRIIMTGSDCKDILDKFPNAESGLYDIKLWSSGKVMPVNCDMETEGGGWTIIHRRIDGSVDFYRKFTEYENGFGNSEGELWLGLKYMKELAEQGSTEIRIDVTNAAGYKGQETHQDFMLVDGINYTLRLGSHQTTNINTKTLNVTYNYPFSTYDRDLDGKSTSCATERHGAWWYRHCTYVNINGLYVTPGTQCSMEGALKCGHTHGGFDSLNALKSSSMMLRRK